MTIMMTIMMTTMMTTMMSIDDGKNDGKHDDNALMIAIMYLQELPIRKHRFTSWKLGNLTMTIVL